MLILNVCENPDVLRVIYFIKLIIDIVKIIIPIALIILLMIDCAKGVINDNAKFSDTFKLNTNRLINAILVFAIPTVIDIFLEIVNVETTYNSCWANAELAIIDNYQIVIDEAEKKLEEQKQDTVINNNNNNSNNSNNNNNNNNNVGNNSIPTSNSLTPYVNGVQRKLEKGECMSFSDNCYCPTIGKFKGFSFTMEDETSRKMKETTSDATTTSVKVQCSDGTVYKKKVNVIVEDNFRNALNKICELQTTGINGIKINKEDLHVDGTMVMRTNNARSICSPHSYGNAIDINYDWSVTVNGKKYKPYSGQGNDTREEYDSFVNAIGGNENNKLNVNYILWKYAFEPNGFTWGGNWSDGAFDPMHFEVSF